MKLTAKDIKTRQWAKARVDELENGDVTAILRDLRQLRPKRRAVREAVEDLIDYFCASRRTPNYLLAIIRNVADERRERERRQRRTQRQSEQRRVVHEAHLRALHEEEHQRELEPDGAADKALELAREAMDNQGFGLSIAERWLDDALRTIALRGQVALQLAVARLARLADNDELRAWVTQRAEQVDAPPISVRTDLEI